MIDPEPNPAFVMLQSAAGDALACFSAPELSDDQVRDARKGLKKARAALRLLRPALRDSEYRTANRALRDAGRCLSPLRDAHALLALLARCKAPDASSERVIATLSSALEAELDTRRTALIDVQERRRCAHLIEDVREHLGRQDVAQADARSLRRGLRATYRCARQSFAAASRRRSDETTMHEWRKRTKYLRNAAETLSDAGLRGLRKPIRHAERIAQALGDEHDLAVLSGLIHDRGLEADAAALLARLERRRATLRKAALACGARLFAAKPVAFAPGAKGFKRAFGGTLD